MLGMARPLASVTPGYIWEHFYPVVTGVIIFGVMIVYGGWIFAELDVSKVELGNMYTAISGLFAIITGFLATFYGSIQAVADTRLRRISKTIVFLRFIGYVKLATKAGFFIAVLSIPYILLTPTPLGGWPSKVLVAAWCGACAYGLASFVRVAGMLFFIFEYQPPEDEGAV